MPTILTLDTSTAQVSVAVLGAGGVVARRVPAGRRTGALLAPTVRDVMAEAQVAPATLDAVAVGVGPGPYTSLRAGIMFAKAVGFALDVPVVGACSLDIMARAVVGPPLAGSAVVVEPGAGDVVVAIDARRREVYWARYDAVGRRVAGPMVGPPGQVGQANTDAIWWGPGGGGNDAGRGTSNVGPDAAVLARWVAAQWPLDALPAVAGDWDGARGDGAAAGWIPHTLLAPEPLYLRRPDATEPTATAATAAGSS